MRDYQKNRLRDHFRSYWRPEPDIPVWKWAEENVVLSSLESADTPGPFNSLLTPFIREPLECFRDPEVNEVTLVFGSQICKTLMIMLGVAWWLANHSGRLIWIMDTRDNALSFSKTRWQPLLRDCPQLAALIPTGRDDFSNLEQRIGGSLINFVGSNSAGNIASRPADIIVMDEVDKFAVTTSREANAIDLAEQRLKSRANTKIIKTSTPTEINGLIWKSFLNSDQRKYYVPCPHCGNEFIFEFEHIQWDQKAKHSSGWDYAQVQRTARYHCPHCSAEIHDGQKTAMLRSSNWQPTSKETAVPGSRGYQLTSLYSPWAKTTFGALAVEFLKHKSRFDMKGWDNGYMARPTEEDAERVEWEVLASRREKYLNTPLEQTLSEAPRGVALLTAFCDVQDTWLEWFCWGWGEGSENWLCEHIRIEGPPSQRYTWNALADIILAVRPLPLDWTFIDYGGHFGQESIEFVRRMRAHRVYLSKGDENADCPVNGRIGKTKKPVTRLFHTGVNNAKRRIISMYHVDEKGAGYCHFPDEADDEFFKQLSAEELRTKYQKGAPVEYFFQTRSRNEALDGHVGCYAGLKRLPDQIMRRRIVQMKNRDAQSNSPLNPAAEKNNVHKSIPRKKQPPASSGFVNNW